MKVCGYNARNDLMLLFSKAPLLASATALLAVSTCIPARSQVAGPSVSTSAPGRREKEAQAPQVMASSAASGSQLGSSLGKVAALDEAAEMEAFAEAQKRLSKIDKSDPARALAEYKKFWQGRTPHSVVAIQVALKVAELRLGMGDVRGALFTCDTMQKKYVAEPTSVQLTLQQAQILVSQKRIDEAAAVVDEALPKLLALPPSSYLRTSEVLLNMGQIGAEAAGEKGQKSGEKFYEGVEQVYLRWLKAGTISHTWQLFETLRTKYQEVGNHKRANELLPKAADVLLGVEPTAKNPEGADISLEAARWLVNIGRREDAQRLFRKVAGYGNDFVTRIADLDMMKLFADSNSLLRTAESGSGDQQLASLVALSNLLYAQGKLAESKAYADRVVASKDQHSDRFKREAHSILLRIDQWTKSPIVCDPRELLIDADPEKSNVITRRLTVKTLQPLPLVVSTTSPFCRARLLEQDPWSASASVGSNRGSEAEVLVEVDPRVFGADAEVLVVLKSPKIADFQVRVPVRIKRN